MNVLITGGTGLVGKAMTSELLSQGHSVYILSRSPDKADSLPQDAQLLRWDSETVGGWGSILEEIDGVINLAGSPLNGDGPLDIWLTDKRKKLLIESRLNSSGALIEGIRTAKHRPKVFIHASAIGFYGAHGDEIIDESFPAGDDYLAQVQYLSEQATKELDVMNVRKVLIRTGLVLAKNEGALEYFKLQFKLFGGGRLGSGEQYYSWIHLQDEVSAIRYLLENDLAEGPYNLVAPNPEKNKNFAKIMGKVMRRPSFMVIPAFLLRMVLGEVATVVLDGQKVTSNRLESLGFKFKFPRLEEALRDVL